nr:hypothetical protein [uncultured Albidiferax sp.]
MLRPVLAFDRWRSLISPMFEGLLEKMSTWRVTTEVKVASFS